jgi:hypothetical protein
MQRCERHALDTKGPEFENAATGSIFVIGQDIGLRLKHIVQPSYRLDVQYATSIAFTKGSLFGASCTYKVGPERDNDQHCCVHQLPPLILLLAITLYDGLADHFLCELTARLGSFDDTRLSPEENICFLSSLSTLIQAAAADHVAEEMNSVTTTKILLDKYQVGTERAKKGRSSVASQS